VRAKSFHLVNAASTGQVPLVSTSSAFRSVKIHRAGRSASGFLAACLNPVTSKSRSRSERMPTSQLAFTTENAESFSTGFSNCFSSNCFLSGITVLPVSPGGVWVNDRSKQQLDHTLNRIAWLRYCIWPSIGRISVCFPGARS